MKASYLDCRGEPRVVVTGMGMLSPIGKTVDENWESILNGASGIDNVTLFDADDLPCQIAGEVKAFDPTEYMPRKEARRMARCSQLAIAATREAMHSAGFNGSVPNPERTGVLVGTAIGGFDYGEANMHTLRTRGLSKVSPFAILGALPNMVSHYVSAAVQARGPINTIATACATGTQSIGEAFDYIRRGRADMMIAGGSDGMVHPCTLAGFAVMRGLVTGFNQKPAKACRPFTRDRSGFIVSEGAGVVILERMDQAIERGAKIFAEIKGHASSSDAFHMAALDPTADGAVRCMQWALQDGKVDPGQIGYINAHGSSTPTNDRLETIAIKRVFGERAYDIPISSTKALTGHALGAAGALEAIYTIKAMDSGILPPTWHYDIPDPELDLDYIPNQPRESVVDVALSNSFGLGGQNASLVLANAALI